MAIIDLISILPSLTVLNSGFKLLKLFRLLRALKVFRTFKFLRYSKSFEIIIDVFKKQKRVLISVATMAIAYVLVSALVIYNVEPESFGNFFDAIYWATVSLTTVGYGDIYPVTTIGRIVTMISSVFGIAIIALPSGVITAGYLSEVNKVKQNDKNKEN
jgi:voltage-gated potassium channel